MPNTSQTWIDRPAFSFADVVRLTGYKPSRIHGYVIKQQFRPQYSQPRGGAIRVERRTYTGRDVLRLLLLGPAVRFGVHLAAGDRFGASQPTLDALMRDLDAHIAAVLSGNATHTNERVVFPRLGGPWAYLVLDLRALAETQIARFGEYRRLRDEGIELAKAARDSWRVGVTETMKQRETV